MASQQNKHAFLSKNRIFHNPDNVSSSKSRNLMDITNTTNTMNGSRPSSMKSSLALPPVKDSFPSVSRSASLNINMSKIKDLKDRQDKIRFQRHTLRTQLIECEREIKTIKFRDLNKSRFELYKKKSKQAKYLKQVRDLTQNLNSKDGERADLIKKNKSALATLQAELDQNLILKRQESQELYNNKLIFWENELQIMENVEPDHEITEEISQLKKTLQELNINWANLQKQNLERQVNHESQLRKDFIAFKEAKLKSMENLTNKHRELLDQIATLQSESEKLHKEIMDIDRQAEYSEQNISEINENIKQLELTNNPLISKSLQNSQDLEHLQNQMENLKEMASKQEKFYNDTYNTVEKELLRSRRLENSIIEQKGTMRCYAYVMEQNLPENLLFDYENGVITQGLSEHVYKFNRVIPHLKVSEDKFFTQEYSVYHDMCLNQKKNFNLISLSTTPHGSLRESLIKFLAEKDTIYQKQYVITLQFVFLSDDEFSQDMLLDYSHNDKDSIKLKFEKHSISLDSKLVIIENGLEDLPLNFSCDEHPNLPHSGMGIIKVQFFPRDSKSDGNNDPVPVDFYFIELNNLKSIEQFDKSIFKKESCETPIALVLKKLISDTKSFFLLNLNDSKNVNKLLTISEEVQTQLWKRKKKLT
ncbi:vegetative interaction with Kar3p [Saccharomyces cerevisiae]|nr:ALH_1c_G0053040.mRNA.1.CDS.1 [Saccharomyces cerevisiae]CAI4845508.1 ALH_1b_G0053310.mRNA.1.CDS.1 [Saccharomyces cerevisiae]CAI5314563.1 AKR_HP2_G0049910.mRNA.1.CDS.1 [Saccharomyces cerevisiae]CAI6698446.1 AKR_HP2_G0049910.mRNA.1.CDS.1 [Saccharomyces cerevisiae]CAI6714449.1 AKR_HP1_G0051730.mRNA.1.CDS.1 [Saccharomyces cerevisiae]